jgi:hypothetical protein
MSVSLERPLSLTDSHSLSDPLAESRSAVAIRRIARGLARDAEQIDRLPVDPHERTWLRLPTAPDVAAWMIRWPAGTSTGWHDHIGENGGVRGAFVVVEGLLGESTWTAGGPVARRLGPGSLRSFGPTYVHDVHSIGPEAAISVHVYSPLLTAMRTYSIDTGELLMTGIGPLDEW